MNECVLVVDDDESLREVLCEALTLRGYPATPLANGREALDWLHTNGAPCLILLDLMMPVMNGWDFLDAQAKDPALAAIPVVVLSASHKVGALGAATLTKPVDLTDLVAIVARYC